MRNALVSLLCFCAMAVFPQLGYSADIYVTINVVDEELNAIPAVALTVNGAELEAPITRIGNVNGQTSTILLPEGLQASVSLHEGSCSTGTTLGTVKSFTVASAVPGATAAHNLACSQPIAVDVLLAGNGKIPVTVSPTTATGNWSFLLPKDSKMKAKLGVGMLWNPEEVAGFMSYYGYSGSLNGVKRGAVVKVPDIDFGQLEGPALRFYETGFDYRTHGAKLLVIGRDSEEPTTLTLEGYRADPSLQPHKEDCIGLRGAVNSGFVVILWTENTQPTTGVIPREYSSNNAPSYQVPPDGEPPVLEPATPSCNQCVVPTPNHTSGWSCQMPTGEASSSNGCDPPVYGGMTCNQQVIAAGPTQCLSAPGGSVTLSITNTEAISVSVSLRIRATTISVGQNIAHTDSTSITQTMTGGAHGCGECARPFRKALLCAQSASVTVDRWEWTWRFGPGGGPELNVYPCDETRDVTLTCWESAQVVAKCSQTPVVP